MLRAHSARQALLLQLAAPLSLLRFVFGILLFYYFFLACLQSFRLMLIFQVDGAAVARLEALAIKLEAAAAACN